MQRFLITVLGLVLACEACFADEPKAVSDQDYGIVDAFPTYSDLGEWISLTRRKDFKLLKAASQNGYYVAVYRVGDNGIAFCSRPSKGQDRQSHDYHFLDSDGKDFLTSKKVEKVAILRIYTVKNEKGTATVRYVDGRMHMLPFKPPDRFRVLYTVADDTGPSRTVFDESIEWAE